MKGSSKSLTLLSFSYIIFFMLINFLQPTTAVPPHVGNASTSIDLYHLSSLVYDDGVAQFPNWESESTRRILATGNTPFVFPTLNKGSAANCKIYGNCVGRDVSIKTIQRPCKDYARCSKSDTLQGKG